MSIEKVKLEPIEREKLKTWPWLTSVWQKARHLDAMESSPQIAVLNFWSFLLCSADSDIKSVVPLTPKISELPGHLLSCLGQLKLLITPSLKPLVFTLYYNIWTKSHSKYVSV